MKHIKPFHLFESNTAELDTDTLIKMLKKNFPSHAKPNVKFPLEIKDNEGNIKKTVEIVIDKQGDLTVNDDAKITENKVAKSLAALCLVGGMLTSCSKPQGGFGYNISAYGTKHVLDNPKATKDLVIYTPNGSKSIKVDTTDAPNRFGASHGIYVAEEPTADEQLVVKFGAAMYSEINQNNGRGYDASKFAWTYDIKDVELNPQHGYETSGDKPLSSIRKHGDYKRGIDYIKQYPLEFEAQTGKNAAEFLQKMGE